MKFVPHCHLFVAAVLSAAGSSESADWTQFRGPTGQGHADVTHLPLTWSENENIDWKVAMPGFGWSSPVVADGRLYLTTAVAEDDSGKVGRSLRVLCLNAENGEILWNEEVFGQGTGNVAIHGKNSHASPTPVLEGDRIYVHFGPHGTACLKIDGSIEWKTQDLVFATPHGGGGSPAIADDRLIVCCDGSDERFVVGLDKRTGQQIWRTERQFEPSSGFSFSTPTILNAGGRSQAVCPGSGGVWSYDPKTGKQLWRVAYGEGFSVIPRPVVAHGLVYVCSGFGDGQLLAIDPTGSGDVTDSHIKWKRKKGVPNSPSLLVVGDAIYMVNDRGIASCVDAISGQLHWQHRLQGAFSASPSFADGMIYFQNETGVTTVVRPDREYQEVARNKLGDGKSRTFASFAFVNSAILLRSETHLYRIQNPL
jgi:outer membrane protein assembly factor BamB